MAWLELEVNLSKLLVGYWRRFFSEHVFCEGKDWITGSRIMLCLWQSMPRWTAEISGPQVIRDLLMHWLWKLKWICTLLSWWSQWKEISFKKLRILFIFDFRFLGEQAYWPKARKGKHLGHFSILFQYYQTSWERQQSGKLQITSLIPKN
jgi:hypothetical protein